MHKRGQLSESALHYLIVMVCVGAVLGIGYYSFSSVQERLCKTELSKFQLDFKGIDREIGEGSVEQKEFSIPCDADEVYFVDSKKAKAEYFANPLIRDAVTSSVEKNIFVVKDGKVEGSFFAGELQMAYPGYSCLVPRSGEVEVFAEGKGKGVEIIPGCYQVECTDIPVVPDDDEAREILDQFLEFDCPLCPADVAEIIDNMNDYRNALQKMKVIRRYTYCPDTGLTKVEIILSPELKKRLRNFRFFEYIPKECIQDLNDFLEETFGGGATATFSDPDPLLMWQFDELDEETTLSYTLNTEFNESCRDIIAGIGIPEIVEDAEIPITPLTNNPPQITSLPAPLILQARTSKIDMYMNGYVDDDHDPDTDLVWSNPTVSPVDEGLTVSIDPANRNQLIIHHDGEWSGDATVTFTVTDSLGESTTNSMTVRVIDAVPLGTIPDVTLMGAGAIASIDLRDYADFDGRLITTTLSETNPAAASCVKEDEYVVSCTARAEGESEIEVVITDNDFPDLKSYASFKVHVVPSADDFYAYTCKIYQGESCVSHNLLGNPTETPCPDKTAEKNGCCGGGLSRVACGTTWGFLGKVKYRCIGEETNHCQPSTDANPCDGDNKKLISKIKCTPSCSPTGTQRGYCVVPSAPFYADYAGYRCESPTSTTVQLNPNCGTCGCASGKVCMADSSCQTPPFISDPGAKTVAEGNTLTFTLSITDPDGAPVSLSASALPSGAAFDSAAKTFSWTPGYDQGSATPYTITFTATDSTGLSSARTVSITVTNTLRGCGAYPHGACTDVSGMRCDDGVAYHDPACDRPCTRSPNLYGPPCSTLNAFACFTGASYDDTPQRRATCTDATNPSGSGYCLAWYNNPANYCPFDKICSGSNADCVDPACTKNYYHCYSVSQTQQCSPSGNAWMASESCGPNNVCLKSSAQSFQDSPCEQGCMSESTGVAVGGCIGSQKCSWDSGILKLPFNCNCPGASCPSGQSCKPDGTCYTPAPTCTSDCSYPGQTGCDDTQYRTCQQQGSCYVWGAPSSCGFNSYGLRRVCTGAGECKDRLEISQAGRTYVFNDGVPPCTFKFYFKNNQPNTLSLKDYHFQGYTYNFPFSDDIPSNSEHELGPIDVTSAGTYTLQFRDTSDIVIGAITISCN